MKLTRCGRGVAVLALALAIISLFFDDVPAAVAAGGLVFLLAARAAVFLSAFSATAGSLSVSRSVSSRFVRQGTVIAVVTRVDHTLPPSFSLEIEDQVPDGSVIAGGSSHTDSAVSCSLTYSIAPMSIGEHPFRGIRCMFSDLFFSTTLVDRRATGPSLTVLPSTEYALAGKDTYGESETPVISPLASPGIRSFREYVPGDDPRKIDWKLSAKHDTLYVREYMGRADASHLLIIDLPDPSVPFSPEAFTRLKEAAVAAIAREVSGSAGISVLLVSGPNVISFSPVEADPGRVTAMMQQLTPTPRLHSLYRYISTPALRRRSARLLKTGAEPVNGSLPEDVPAFPEESDLNRNGDTYVRTLSRVTGSFLTHRTATAYETQVARSFSTLSTNTAHLFSLARGDVSHLCLLAEQAMVQGMAVHLHLPREADDPVTRAKIRRCRFASVEAV